MERALSVAAAPSSLDDPKVKSVLDRLHDAAAGDTFRMLGRLPTFIGALMNRNLPAVEMSRRFKDVYIPLSRPQGKLLYLVARSIDARRIVEFGTSFGISTLYAAAAARDFWASGVNGGVRPSGGSMINDVRPIDCPRSHQKF